MKGKGKDNNMNLVEQVCSLQVSARVFAAAADAEPYANTFNCQNEKRVLWRDRQCFLHVHHLGNPLESSSEVGFSCAVKIQKKGIFILWIFFLKETAVFFVKLRLDHTVRIFDELVSY